MKVLLGIDKGGVCMGPLNMPRGISAISAPTLGLDTSHWASP